MAYVFDTNVAISAFRDREGRDRFNAFIRANRAQVLLHATVWLELQVGARSREEIEALQSFVAPFQDSGRVVTPSAGAWEQAGRVLAQLADEHGVDVRRSSIHHDALIAASARERDLTVVTNNLSDFNLIAPYLRRLSYTAPYPRVR